MIANERRRQVEAEGWTPEHDAQHAAGELAEAAACYAVPEPLFVQRSSTIGGSAKLPNTHFTNLWPFGCWHYKPKDRVRDLVRAGALIAAEIDRLLAADDADEGT